MKLTTASGIPMPGCFTFLHAGATISVSTLNHCPEICVFLSADRRKSVGPLFDMATAMRIAEVAQAQRALQDGHL